VNNPYQRNATEKEGIITVGSPPDADFSADILSGPDPLTVQFFDNSAGYPSAWTWDFGDGDTSEEQNPQHVYSMAGTYSVSLRAENKWGNGTAGKSNYISVVDGTSHKSIFPDRGIEIVYTDTGARVVLNTSDFPGTPMDPVSNTSVLTFILEPGSGIQTLDLFSGEDVFTPVTNETTEGNLVGIRILSQNCTSTNQNVSPRYLWAYNYSLSLPEYPLGGMITSTIWEGSTPEDSVLFEQIAIENYHHVNQTAVTIQFSKENIWASGPATLVIGIDSNWIEQNGWRWSHDIDSEPSGATVYVDSKYAGHTPLTLGDGLAPGNHTVSLVDSGYRMTNYTITVGDKRENIQAIRISDDGIGSFCNTTFLFHDSTTNMDYFRVDSPEGLSKFGLTSTRQEGSIFQLLQLIATKALGASGGGGGGGGSGGGGGGGGDGDSAVTAPTTPSKTVAPTPAATVQPTAAPTQGRASAPGTIRPTGIQPEPTGSGGEAAAPPAELNQTSSLLGFFTTGTSSIIVLKNISIVFVVIFVTIVFYYRWRRKEE
jgi:PKD repeat protein